MKRMSYLVPVACSLALAAIVLASALIEPCCSVIAINGGKLTVRNRFTGRIMQINSAEIAQTVKVGDEMDASPTMDRIVSVKGVAKTAALVEPEYAAPCCSVVAVSKDKSIANGLLQGIVTMAGKPYDAVAPFHGVVIAKDNKTGALHVLETAVHLQKDPAEPVNSLRDKTKPAEPVNSMTPLFDEIKSGDPVHVMGNHGTLKIKGAHYAFKLRGAEGKDKQPWVIEPDADAEGRYGAVKTNWIEKTNPGHQAFKVYLPGKRDKDEYHENWKTSHDLMEGEYDLMINGMVLEKVPIKAGHATRILMGALKSTAKYEQQLVIHDLKGNLVRKIQGGEQVSLPIGTYQIKVGTRMVKVDIRENEVTNF